MRSMLVLLLVVAFAAAQNSAVIVTAGGAEVEVPEGVAVTVAPRVVATLARDHLRIRNGGDPDRWNTTAWIPQPFFFREVRVTCQGRRPQCWPMDLSRAGPGVGEWTLAPADAPKHAHHEADDPAQPWYEPSKRLHMIDGGESFYARLTTYEDPYELGPTTAAARYEALRILDADLALLDRWPLLRRVFDLYRFDASSMDLAASPRNFGWFLVPDFFASKYAWPIERSRGWYAWPDHQLPGDGVCNAHYAHDAHWLTSFLISGDPLRRTVGLALVRQKAATGLVDCDRPYPSCRYVGMWRGEKAGPGRRGAPLGPTPAKEWDVGLLMARALAPDDPLIAQACAVRRARLLGVAPADIWNGAGGGRLAGAYLRNLRDHFVASADDAFRAKAEAFVGHLWMVRDAAAKTWDAANPANPMRWFPNGYDATKTAAWEEATLHAQLYWWAERGVGAARLGDLDASLDWMIATCSGARGSEWQVAYSADVVAGTFTSNTPANGLWWVPVAPTVRARLPRHAAAADRWTATAFGRIGQTWAEVDAGRAPIKPAQLGVESGPEGPGAHKMRAYAALAVRR